MPQSFYPSRFVHISAKIGFLRSPAYFDTIAEQVQSMEHLVEVVPETPDPNPHSAKVAEAFAHFHLSEAVAGTCGGRILFRKFDYATQRSAYA